VQVNTPGPEHLKNFVAAHMRRRTQKGLAGGRLLRSAAVRSEQINLRVVFAQRSQHLLHMDRTAFLTEDRHAGVSGDVSDTHQPDSGSIGAARSSPLFLVAVLADAEFPLLQGIA